MIARSSRTNVNRVSIGVSWYRFRATLHRDWGGYLSIVVLVALVGGLAMGSVAAARRTGSSFAVFLAASNPSDLEGVTAVLNPQIGSTVGYNPSLLEKIAHLPNVKQVESYSGVDFLPLQSNGAPLNAPNFYSPAAGNGYGSVNGLYLDQDRVTATAGRVANPARANEFMMSQSGAQALGLRVGQSLPIGIYTNAQTDLPGFGTARVKPYRVINETLVGIAVFNNSILQDQVDEGSAPNNLFTPALTRQFLDCCVNYTATGVRVDASGDVAKVTTEINHALPKGFPPFSGATAAAAKAQRAIKPEAIALGVFGGIVALAALLIAGQLISRQLLLTAGDLNVLRALGAGPRLTSSEGLIGIIGSVVVGSVAAVAVAVGLSPLAPLGPVRPVYPYPGISFDWKILGTGFVLLVVVLSATALILARRSAPHRDVRVDPPQRSRIMSLAESSGLPASAMAGIRMATQTERGRGSVPVRSTVLGTVMAMVVLAATVTFGASLDHLVSHPTLYGWNWDFALVAGDDIPQHQSTVLLDHDRFVSAWTGIYTESLIIDGVSTPVLGTTPGAPVGPPILSGHGLDSANQVVLGAVTLSQLHRHVGQHVTVADGLGSTKRLQIVGIAAFPAMGSNVGAHLEMGSGAMLSYGLIPAGVRNTFNDPHPGPNVILVRLKGTDNRRAAVASLQKIAEETSNTANFGVLVQSVLLPAEIINYRSLGTTPAYLSGGFAIGALIALSLVLLASVRRRRRDFAVYKTLGFTGRQLALTVAWHATITMSIGIVLGIPLGVALGRWLWDLFARNINVVPVPTVPGWTIAIIIIGALALANLIAVIPGRAASRTSTAFLLRSE